MSFKVEVIADNSGRWCGNERVFATPEEAAAYARDLASRWVLVREWRVVPTTELTHDGSDEPSRMQAATAKKSPPSPGELSDRGFVYPNAAVVLHRILAALYRDGPDTDWNADMSQIIGGILDDAGLTYDQWPTPEDLSDSGTEAP
jgi:hypothetical protein